MFSNEFNVLALNPRAFSHDNMFIIILTSDALTLLRLKLARLGCTYVFLYKNFVQLSRFPFNHLISP